MQFSLRIMPQAAFVINNDMGNARQALLDLKQFIDLLLIFGNRKVDFCVIQYVSHVGCRCILVQGYWDAAQALGGRHRPIQARTVVADDGQGHAAPKTECGQAASKSAHFVIDLRPGPGLPDAKVFFTHRGQGRAGLRMLQQ